MKFNEAQKNMQFSYYGGGPGVFASGVVWIIAGITAILATNQLSMLTLFFGGMFIHPLGMMLSKLLKRPGNHEAKNPLGKLALESTFILFIGLFLAFYVAKLQVNWFYPIMLMIIGGRYLLFSTIYGMKVYWILGASLTLSGVSCILFEAPFALGAFMGGTIEIIFSFIIIRLVKDDN